MDPIHVHRAFVGPIRGPGTLGFNLVALRLGPAMQGAATHRALIEERVVVPLEDSVFQLA